MRQPSEGLANFVVYSMYIRFHLEVIVARLTRWGNSLGGLRIPQAILEAAGLHVGDELGCRLLDNGTILLTPHKGRVGISEGQAKLEPANQLDDKW